MAIKLSNFSDILNSSLHIGSKIGFLGHFRSVIASFWVKSQHALPETKVEINVMILTVNFIANKNYKKVKRVWHKQRGKSAKAVSKERALSCLVSFMVIFKFNNLLIVAFKNTLSFRRILLTHFFNTYNSCCHL